MNHIINLIIRILWNAVQNLATNRTRKFSFCSVEEKNESYNLDVVIAGIINEELSIYMFYILRRGSRGVSMRERHDIWG